MPRHIGLIADTHGLIRPEVFEALEGVELVLHAGDVGGGTVLDELARIAPVHAVAGNVDMPVDPRLRDRLAVTLDGVRIHVSHGHELGAPTAAGSSRNTTPMSSCSVTRTARSSSGSAGSSWSTRGPRALAGSG